MIINNIVRTLVVPPNVNPHNKCIWTRAYYLLQDIEHRNDKPHVFFVTIIWWHLEADVRKGDLESRSCTPPVGCGSQRTATVQSDGCTTSMRSRRWARRRRIIRQDTVYQLRSESGRVALWRADGQDKVRRGSGEWWSHCKDPSHPRRPRGNIGERPNGQFVWQYLDMIRILHKIIRAERLGNWYLHLEAVSEMLPHLAAYGHSLYAKSTSINFISIPWLTCLMIIL